MSRYIKTDALMEDIVSLYRDEDQTDYNVAIADALDVIDEQPATDVVDVVRCKDCKYYLHSNEKCELIDTRLHFYETDNTWAEDAFCAWGKRRDDDKGDDQVPKTVR